MSGSASLTLEQGILQHTLGIAAMAFPAQVYVALCAAGLPPSETIGGVEAFGGGYSRVATTFALLASPTNVAANTASVEFPLATAGWGSLGYFEIWTAQTGGSRLYWGPLVDPATGAPLALNVAAGDIARFSAGALAVQAAAPTASGVSGVSSFNTRTGAVVLSNSDVVDVLPPSANPPLMDGTAAVGTSAAWARGDHVHPSDTAIGVNVKNYGAVGDGVTNDAPAFAAALAAVAAGGSVIVPSGSYALGAALSQAITGAITFQGAGSGVTVLRFTAATDGLTLSLAPAAAAHVRGLTIARAVASPVYANTGLAITTPSAQTARPAISTVSDVFVMGDATRTTGWAVGVSINNTSSASLDHVYVNMPDANGTFGNSFGIALAGLNASSYLVEVALNDVSTLGGSIGLQLGDWIQGVYVSNSRFIGNDYGIRWAGAAGEADLLLTVVNSHVNSGSRGIQTVVASAPQIVNTYALHFPIASTASDWAGFEFQTADSGLVSSNNIYCNGSASATPEYGIRLVGSNTSTIIGNHINNPKTAGIYLATTVSQTIIANNVGSAFGAGIPLISDASGASSNQKLGNQTNGVPDITINSAGMLVAPYGVLSAAGMFQIAPGYYLQRDGGTGFWNFVEGGTTTLTVQPDGQVYVGSHLHAVNGVVTAQAIWTGATGPTSKQVLGQQITGWGTSAGGVRGAITGSSTLPQVAAALAQLLTDLKTHGLLGT